MAASSVQLHRDTGHRFACMILFLWPGLSISHRAWSWIFAGAWGFQVSPSSLLSGFFIRRPQAQPLPGSLAPSSSFPGFPFPHCISAPFSQPLSSASASPHYSLPQRPSQSRPDVLLLRVTIASRSLLGGHQPHSVARSISARFSGKWNFLPPPVGRLIGSQPCWRRIGSVHDYGWTGRA